MGWSFCDNWQTKQDVTLAITLDHSGGGWTFLDQSTVGNTFYGLLERTKDAKVERLILVCILKKDRDTAERKGSWGYKSMTEDMGPYYWDCPVRILDKADEVPSVSKSCDDWRKKCRARIAFKKVKSNLTPGTVVLLREGCHFRGQPLTRATVVQSRPLRVQVDEHVTSLKPSLIVGLG